MDLSMNRFDLIFLMLDPQNELFDKRLAKHLVSLYYKTRDEEEDELMVCNYVFFHFILLRFYCLWSNLIPVICNCV